MHQIVLSEENRILEQFKPSDPLRNLKPEAAPEGTTRLQQERRNACIEGSYQNRLWSL
ncbi:MAG: hypothetical protein K8R77_04420 [Anaerolineaceae bacterium]|nr:hypothetical protein [Anaerolineaceae bacterium]